MLRKLRPVPLPLAHGRQAGHVGTPADRFEALALHDECADFDGELRRVKRMPVGARPCFAALAFGNFDFAAAFLGLAGLGFDTCVSIIATAARARARWRGARANLRLALGINAPMTLWF
jgi:hypothetical protein